MLWTLVGIVLLIVFVPIAVQVLGRGLGAVAEFFFGDADGLMLFATIVGIVLFFSCQ